MSRSPADGFQVVAISPNIPGIVPHGMNNDFSRMTIVSSTEHAGQLSSQPVGHQFVKAKRKRLSKACENCHKSKRRCDGTAPCSNCYFASKSCIYLDKDGKQVPAPRAVQQDMPGSDMNMSPGTASPRNLAPPAQTNGQAYSATSGQRRQTDLLESSTKRVRAEGLSPTTSTASSLASPQSETMDELSPIVELDEAMILDLVNLFFTHCNPHRLIFHRPTFSSALAQDQVPLYLLYAICALAAPWSHEMRQRAKEKMPRLAGVPFFLKSRQIMFDEAGHLLSPPTLATAQALCLLEMHEVAASHSWTLHYRYFDLAMQFLEGTLQVTQPDEMLAAGVPPGNMRDFTVERECVRRCFWLVQAMFHINGIYTYRPLRPRSVELMRQVRLPVDETSFELEKSTTTPEYLHVPAPRSKYASQFGHVCRVLSLYQTLQSVIAQESDENSRAAALASCRQSLEMWLASLPDHLRFSEENLHKQIAMHETSSNTGAWCFCFIHILHPCFVLDFHEAEGTLQAQPQERLRTQLKTILNGAGSRAKNSILSACTLWTYSKYFPSDPDIEEWDKQFEGLWGYRVAVVANHWRETQRKQHTQIGRTYPVESAPRRGEAAPAFVASESESSPEMSSRPSSTRSSPRERTVGTASSSAAASWGVGAGEQQQQQQVRQIAGRPVRGGSPQQLRSGSTAGLPVGVLSPGQMSPEGPLSARTLRPQQSLPSLKASGLLDSWKPSGEGFVQPHTGAGHAHVQSLSKGPGGGSGPIGLDWLSGPQQ